MTIQEIFAEFIQKGGSYPVEIDGCIEMLSPLEYLVWIIDWTKPNTIATQSIAKRSS